MRFQLVRTTCLALLAISVDFAASNVSSEFPARCLTATAWIGTHLTANCWALPTAGLFGRRRRCCQPTSLRCVPVCQGESATTCAAVTPPPDKTSEWRSLFDGKSLAGWDKTNFGGESEVHVDDGKLILDMGYSLTGVTYNGGDLPKTNYEIELDTMRIDGSDFFCALTFPVAESHCSLIVGGWAGGVVGISSIDGRDASENDTTRYQLFESDRWYHVRVRVEPERIQAWIDNEQVVDQDIVGKNISTRAEVDLSIPLGICTYETTAAFRNIRLRRLTAE